MTQSNYQASVPMQQNLTNSTYQNTGQINDMYSGLNDYYGGMMRGADNVTINPSAGVSVNTGPNSGFGISMPGYKTFADTGGYDDPTKAAINTNINQLGSIGQTGGVDAAAQQNILGNGYYQQLQQTGGISPQQQALMKAQGQQSVGSTFQNLQNSLQRQNAATGGIGFGAGAAGQALARTGARALGDQSVNTGLSIQNAINAGKLQGTQGLSSAQQGLSTLQTSNMLSGADKAATQQRALQDSINQGMQWGLTKQEATLQAQEAAQRSAAAANANAANDAAYKQAMVNLQIQNQGAAGLMDLRGQNAGLAGTYGNQALGALGQGQTAAGQYQQANPYQSTLGQITSGLGTIGSLASGGLGSLVGIGKRKTG